MAQELYANDASTTVAAAADGNAGTETWVVASSASFPAASSIASPPTQFHVADPAAPSELILVTDASGTSWSVTRGAEGTTPVPHAAGYTIAQVLTAGDLTAMATYTGDLSLVSGATEVVSAHLGSPLPVTQGGIGTGSLTTYAVLTGGTASTTAVQQIPVGSSGNVLTSNGAGQLPSFQAATGGTGLTNPMSALGDMISGGTAGTAARLAGGTVASKRFLTQTGAGTVSAAPAWGTIATTDLPAGSAGQVLAVNSSSAVAWASTPVDWLNVVTQFGADPSGVMDASTAFSNALAAGKFVYAPAGTYLVNSGISIPPGTTLRGAGITATLFHCTASGVNVVAVNGSSGAGEVEYPALEKVAILGPGTGAGYGLYVSWTTAIAEFRDISVSGSGSHGVYITNTYNAVFSNIGVSGSGGDGFHAVTNVNVCTFQNCLSAGNVSGAGFSLNGGAGTLFSGCTAEANQGHGFTLTSMFGGGIYGGDSESNGGDGTSANVYIGASSSAVQVHGLSMNGGTITTVNLKDDGGTNTYISGNVFSAPAGGGNDIVLTSNAVRPRMASNSAIGGGHAALVISDSSGTGVYDTGTNVASLLSGPATPSDNGYICQNYDPATSSVNVSSGMVNYTAGQVFLSRIVLRQAIVSGKKLYCWWVQGAGGTITNLNCYIAAFNSSGTQLGSTSADLHSSASGLQSVTLPALSPQSVYGAVLIGTQQSGTGLTNAAGLMYATGAIGVVSSTFATGDGLGPSAYRCAHQLTGQGSMPTSLTLSSNVASIPYFWLAIGS